VVCPDSGSPVALVRTAAEGVPRAGVTRVGEVALTKAPVPVGVPETYVAPSVPELVTGEPVTVKSAGSDRATEVTPTPLPQPTS
jgi:hypothetical protein